MRFVSLSTFSAHERLCYIYLSFFASTCSDRQLKSNARRNARIRGQRNHYGVVLQRLFRSPAELDKAGITQFVEWVKLCRDKTPARWPDLDDAFMASVTAALCAFLLRLLPQEESGDEADDKAREAGPFYVRSDTGLGKNSPAGAAAESFLYTLPLSVSLMHSIAPSAIHRHAIHRGLSRVQRRVLPDAVRQGQARACRYAMRCFVSFPLVRAL